MKQSLKIIPVLSVLALIALSILAFSYFAARKAHASVNVGLYAPFVTGSTLCGNASSTLVFATSTSGRNIAYISNNSAQAIYLGLGTAAVADKGVMIAASSTLRFDAVGSYAGAVYCTAKGTTASTSWSDSQS